MKQFNLFFMSCLLATSMCFMAGCDDKDDPDNPSNSVPDPEGTIMVSMRNDNNGVTTIQPDNCYNVFYIGKDDNFTGSRDWKFVSIGAMNGLGNVTKIPTVGWASKVAVVPGYGYVAASYESGSRGKISRVTFVRIYVNWITSATTDGVIGAEVKYQSPFSVKPDAKEITLSETMVNVLPQAGLWCEIPNSITIYPFNVNWSVTSSDENWCQVSTNDINSFRILIYDNSPRTATLTVKVEGLPEKTITVTQAGKN